MAPAGLGARDSLRLEAGLCLYGNDIDELTTPVEANLAWTVAKRRREAKDFPGAVADLRPACARPDPAARRHPPGRPRPGPGRHRHRGADGTEAGTVTSGGFGPTAGGPVAMGYVRRDLAAEGTAAQPAGARQAAAGPRRRPPVRPPPLRPLRKATMIRYTKDHEWVRLDGTVATVGITTHAQDALGDLVFVELPEPGREVDRGRGGRRGRVGEGRERRLRPARRPRDRGERRHSPRTRRW